MTLIEQYGWRPVSGFMLDKSIYVPTTDPIIGEETIFGLELEFEKWYNCARRSTPVGGFKYEEDGSLRDEGKECITYPTKHKYLESLLKKFFGHHKMTMDNYSERCSTHVHMNVQHYTWDRLKSLALVYQVVERLLFKYVGVDREENNFCVPWYQSGISPHFVEKMQANPTGTIGSWVKYSALNFLPIQEQGSVEFRHLEGTCDIARIMEWLAMLAGMDKYTEDLHFEALKDNILSMNTVSNYDQFVGEVFGAQAGVLLNHENAREMLSFGVVDAKMLLTARKNRDKPLIWDDDVAPEVVAERTLGQRLADVPLRGFDAARVAPQVVPPAAPRGHPRETRTAEGRRKHENVGMGLWDIYRGQGWEQGQIINTTWFAPRQETL